MKFAYTLFLLILLKKVQPRMLLHKAQTGIWYFFAETLEGDLEKRLGFTSLGSGGGVTRWRNAYGTYQ